MFGLGKAISAIGLGMNLWKSFKEAKSWKEGEKLAGFKWVEVAKRKGVLDPEIKYSWRRPEHVETLLLEGTHDLVYALDEETKPTFPR